MESGSGEAEKRKHLYIGIHHADYGAKIHGNKPRFLLLPLSREKEEQMQEKPEQVTVNTADQLHFR